MTKPHRALVAPTTVNGTAAMIVERVRSGIARARERGTKSGKAIGRPRIVVSACGSWPSDSASGARLCGASCVVATRGPLPLAEIVLSEHNLLLWTQRIPLGRMAPTVRICRG
jgi:hypothetical protein